MIAGLLASPGQVEVAMWRLMSIAIVVASLVALMFCIDVTAEDAAEAATPAQHALSSNPYLQRLQPIW
jgi:hypothetical protein